MPRLDVEPSKSAILASGEEVGRWGRVISLDLTATRSAGLWPCPGLACPYVMCNICESEICTFPFFKVNFSV